MRGETIVLIALGALIVLWVIFDALYRVIAARVGDCAVRWADGYLKVEDIIYPDENIAIIKFALPIQSKGKQQCLMIDVMGRLSPEGDKLLGFDNQVYVYPGDNRRRDRYWEATLIKPGDTLILQGEILLSGDGESMKKILQDLGDIKLDLYYKYYCRNLMEYKRKTLTFSFAEKTEDSPANNRYETVDTGGDTLPIRTPLLVPGDNLYDVFDKYVKKHIKPGDILAICESALAILEGRAYYVEDIRPGFLATHLNKLFKMDSSLSSPYSLEMGIREVGAPKIIFSIVMGALGRLVGRAGDFYAFAGRAVATIDDCTGTLPPFDKYVVMGPKNPHKTAQEFKERTGFDLTVVDVNDLGKVDVLASSAPEARERIVAALKTNPQGNANQQMPVAIIRGASK